MGKKKKKTSESTSTPPAPSRQPPAESAPPPLSSARLPLLDLSSGDLGAFFELCFPDKRLLALCHELKLHTPGYRLEALPPDQVARVLADEYLAAKDVRPLRDGAVREVLRDPVLASRGVSARAPRGARAAHGARGHRRGGARRGRAGAAEEAASQGPADGSEGG